MAPLATSAHQIWTYVDFWPKIMEVFVQLRNLG
jgi:hypothetical protein